MPGKPREGRFYAFSLTAGRVRIPANSTDDAMTWAREHVVENVTYEAGPVDNPTVTTKIWDRIDEALNALANSPTSFESVVDMLVERFPNADRALVTSVASDIDRIYRAR